MVAPHGRTTCSPDAFLMVKVHAREKIAWSVCLLLRCEIRITWSLSYVLSETWDRNMVPILRVVLTWYRNMVPILRVVRNTVPKHGTNLTWCPKHGTETWYRYFVLSGTWYRNMVPILRVVRDMVPKHGTETWSRNMVPKHGICVSDTPAGANTDRGSSSCFLYIARQRNPQQVVYFPRGHSESPRKPVWSRIVPTGTAQTRKYHTHTHLAF